MFYNRFVENLSSDKNTSPDPHIVHNAHYSLVDPQPVANPQLIHYSPSLAEHFGLSARECGSQEFLQTYSGNTVAETARPYASCYGGHQFGHWAGQLGDGRAINLGEIVSRDDQYWTAQLKGAGPTPYSRTADGYAVLRSSLREYLCSEAMSALGVPTTRALSLTLTGRSVIRDILYSGNPKPEPGAIVCRLSRSFLRFGHFEILTAQNDLDGLQRLLDFSIRENFPHLCGLLDKDPVQARVQWFAQVCTSSIDLVVHWLRVGFVHGVLNSDNMSVLGETIDYGPYGWMEEYDPLWTPNTTDTGKRYCFAMQARMAKWNLWCLANAILPVTGDEKSLEGILNDFDDIFWQKRLEMMRAKLGLTGEQPDDAELCSDFEDFMHKCSADMTLFYSRLMEISDPATDFWSKILPVLYHPQRLSPAHREGFESLMGRYFARLGCRQGNADPAIRIKLMRQHNPVYVPRNYLAQIAIDAAEEGDFKPLRDLFEVMSHPYEPESASPAYCQMRPDWALDRPGCSMLSCSS